MNPTVSPSHPFTPDGVRGHLVALTDADARRWHRHAPPAFQAVALREWAAEDTSSSVQQPVSLASMRRARP